MKLKEIEQAIEECHRFIEAVNKLKSKQREITDGDSIHYLNLYKRSSYISAVRRASMDLSRALIEMRKT